MADLGNRSGYMGLSADLAGKPVVLIGSEKSSVKVTTHMLRYTFATNLLRSGGRNLHVPTDPGAFPPEMVIGHAAMLQEDMERVHKVASPVE